MTEQKEKKPVAIGQFIREVRQEANKATWPARKEVTVTTIMVLWMSLIAALFFLAVDWVAQHFVRAVLGLF